MSDMKNFKISDQLPRGAERRAKPKTETQQPQSSAGFPHLEALLEQEELDLSGFGQRIDALESLSENGGNKEKAAVKKARVAYERTIDVIEFLLETKAGM